MQGQVAQSGLLRRSHGKQAAEYVALPTKTLRVWGLNVKESANANIGCHLFPLYSFCHPFYNIRECRAGIPVRWISAASTCIPMVQGFDSEHMFAPDTQFHVHCSLIMCLHFYFLMQEPKFGIVIVAKIVNCFFKENTVIFFIQSWILLKRRCLRVNNMSAPV